MSEPIMKTLNMLSEGKLTPKGAYNIIKNLIQSNASSDANSAYNTRLLKMKVVSTDGGSFSANLPIPLVKALIKSIGKIPYTKTNSTEIDSKLIM